MSRRLQLLLVLILAGSVPVRAQAPPHAPAPLVDQALLQRARAEGTVRVIVELGGLHTVPEAALPDGAAVGAQRQAIAGSQAVVRHALRGLRHRIVREFATLPGLAIEASPDALRMLEAMRGVVRSVHEETPIPPALEASVPHVGAPAAWDVGFDGAGTVIAVLDSGVDRAHPFFEGRITDEACFSSKGNTMNPTAILCPNGQETQIGPGSASPCSRSIAQCEHGTHVAGIAAGAGPERSGVAPGATIMAVQVFSRVLGAASITAWPSDIIRGLDRIQQLLSERPELRFAAVNMSLGGGRFGNTDVCDGVGVGDERNEHPGRMMKMAIDNLRAAGVATVIASGNDGHRGALAFPACISTAVSVGSTGRAFDGVSNDSNVADFLSLLAPGERIASSAPGGRFVFHSGTSMAAPHVAGAFAILKQAVPDAGVDRMLRALQETGVPVTEPVKGITKPRIQVDAALRALLPTPSAVIATNGTTFRAGQTVTVTLTAANPGGTPLDLYVGSLWPDGHTIAFLAGPGVFGGLGSLSSPANISPMLTLAPGFSTNGMPVLSYTFPADGVPVGTYQLFASLFPQGSKEKPVVVHAVAVTYSP